MVDDVLTRCMISVITANGGHHMSDTENKEDAKEDAKEESGMEAGVPMTKTLNKVGNSYALILDKPLLQLLQITPETKIAIHTDGKRILLDPQREFVGYKIMPDKHGLVMLAKGRK